MKTKTKNLKPFAALLLCVFALMLSPGASASTVRTNVTLAWNPSPGSIWTITNGTEVVSFTNAVDSYILYSSSNPSLNTTNWPKLVAVPGTQLTVTVPITQEVQFFVVTASNSAGESLPSNVAWKQPAPSDLRDLRLQ